MSDIAVLQLSFAVRGIYPNSLKTSS